MKKWEYKIVHLSFEGHLTFDPQVNMDQLESKFNELGKEGWEFQRSESLLWGYGSTRFQMYIFRREIA